MSGLAPSVSLSGDLTRAAAAHGLAGSMLEFPEASLGSEAFTSLVAEVKTQRLTGLLWQAIIDRALPVTPEQGEQAEWMHVQSLAGALVLEQLLVHTTECLADAEVPVRVLKGTAVGHLDYPDPDQRTFGDIDLLVPGTHFDRAVEVLTAQGHRRLHPQPRPGFDRRFSKGTSFRTVDGMEIDLHRTLTMGPLGIRLDLDSLWRSSETFHIGDRPFQALAFEERFLHACYHAVLGEVHPRLVPLRDVAQMALTGRLDMSRLQSLVRSSMGEAVVARAVQQAWSEFAIADMLAISAWANSYRIDQRRAAELAVYGPGASYANKSFSAIRAIPTLHQRAAFVYALALPTTSYLAQRHSGRANRLRTGLLQATSTRDAT